MKFKLFLLIAIATVLVSPARSQEQSDKHSMHPTNQDEMNKRGDKVMGFDHTRTTHHFVLTKTGGDIEVSANSAEDSESRDQIRKHLSHIAMMFAEGNFKAPILIHEQNPPGVPVMQRLKSDIEYTFEKTESGGRVRISTNNEEALRAIHEFLRFQIKEHNTN
jgi:hypothetical protein